MKIAVIVAMDSEYKRLKQLGDTIGGHTIILEKGGIGKVSLYLLRRSADGRMLSANVGILTPPSYRHIIILFVYRQVGIASAALHAAVRIFSLSLLIAAGAWIIIL